MTSILNENTSTIKGMEVDKASKDYVLNQVGKLNSITPEFVDGTSGMTDAEKVYVNLEDGYIYKHDGSGFKNTGVKYQSTGVSDGEVSPPKTTFFEKSSKNLFDGSYISNYTYVLPGNSGVGNLGGVGYSSNPNRKIAIIEIENEETYTVTKYQGGDRFNVM